MAKSKTSSLETRKAKLQTALKKLEMREKIAALRAEMKSLK